MSWELKHRVCYIQLYWSSCSTRGDLTKRRGNMCGNIYTRVEWYFLIQWTNFVRHENVCQNITGKAHWRSRGVISSASSFTNPDLYSWSPIFILDLRSSFLIPYLLSWSPIFIPDPLSSFLIPDLLSWSPIFFPDPRSSFLIPDLHSLSPIFIPYPRSSFLIPDLHSWFPVFIPDSLSFLPSSRPLFISSNKLNTS
jgi:hypothetical protein